MQFKRVRIRCAISGTYPDGTPGNYPEILKHFQIGSDFLSCTLTDPAEILAENRESYEFEVVVTDGLLEQLRNSPCCQVLE